MANSSFTRFVRPALLFMFVLQAAEISALQCYGCITLQDSPLPPLKDESCLANNLKEELVVNETTVPVGYFVIVLDMLKKMTASSNLVMINKPSCFTFSSYITTTSKRGVLRYIIEKVPTHLDLECMKINIPVLGQGDGKICFCQGDRCNNGTIDLPKLQQVPEKQQTTDSTKLIHSDDATESEPTSAVSLTLPTLFVLVTSLVLINFSSS